MTSWWVSLPAAAGKDCIVKWSLWPFVALLDLLFFLPLHMVLTARPSTRLKEILGLVEGAQYLGEEDLMEGPIPSKSRYFYQYPIIS
jgi:hypothetical protein